MFTDTAVRLIEQLVYKPGWVFEASDYTKRHEGHIAVKITYPAQKSEREEAPDGYPTPIEPYATFAFPVHDCKNQEALYFRLLECIDQIDRHEAREFLRVKPTYWAPFHPHQIDGMQKWAKACRKNERRPYVDADVQFGVV